MIEPSLAMAEAAPSSSHASAAARAEIAQPAMPLFSPSAKKGEGDDKATIGRNFSPP